MDAVQLPKPISIVGAQYRKNVPWHLMKLTDPLTVRLDPYGTVAGEPHKEANAIAVYWQDHHVGYFPTGIANELAPLVKQNLIDLILTLAWIDPPSRVESIVTIRAKTPCAKPSI